MLSYIGRAYLIRESHPDAKPNASDSLFEADPVQFLHYSRKYSDSLCRRSTIEIDCGFKRPRVRSSHSSALFFQTACLKHVVQSGHVCPQQRQFQPSRCCCCACCLRRARHSPVQVTPPSERSLTLGLPISRLWRSRCDHDARQPSRQKGLVPDGRRRER